MSSIFVCDSCGAHSEKLCFLPVGWSEIGGYTHTCRECSENRTKYIVVIIDEDGVRHDHHKKFDNPIGVASLIVDMQKCLPDTWSYDWKAI